LSDLKEIKVFLAIDQADQSSDLKLNFLIEMASAWIEETINRVGRLEYKARTEYYQGTGTQKLYLRARPVLTTPAIRAFVERGGYYGEAADAFGSVSELTYGSDFVLKIDQDNGSSRSGILVRLNEYWPKFGIRQAGYLSPFISEGFGNIKIIYTAGYSQDTLPAQLRLACCTLVAELNMLFPLGFFLTTESYEERNVGYFLPQKKPLLSMIEPMICGFRNLVM
jgi:hypothetical protein